MQSIINGSLILRVYLQDNNKHNNWRINSCVEYVATFQKTE